MANRRDLRKEIDLYLEALLKLQFNASKGISHNPTKGNLREKFIKRILLEKFPKIIIEKGVLTKGTWESSEMDFLFLQCQKDEMDVYDLCDCKLLMEIKSNLETRELTALNNTAKIIKDNCVDTHQIVVGMFCYSSTIKDKTIIKNFGYSYDKELDAYEPYKSALDLFTNIDFLFSLNINNDEETSPYFIARNNGAETVLHIENPVIDFLFRYFKS